MNMLTEALRSLVMRVAWEHDHKVHSANAGLAMNYSTDVIQEVTELNLEIHGGAGGTVARHAEKLVRDSFIWQSPGGRHGAAYESGTTARPIEEASMIKAKRIGHATFDTADLDRQIDYYERVVGLRVAGREANRAFLTNNTGQLAVVLEKGGEQSCSRIAFEVSPELSFDEMAKRLQADGLKSEIRSDSMPGISKDAGVHRSEGHHDRAVFRLDVPADQRHGAERHRAEQARASGVGLQRSAGGRGFLREGAGLPGLGLDQRLFRASCAAARTTTP